MRNCIFHAQFVLVENLLHAGGVILIGLTLVCLALRLKSASQCQVVVSATLIKFRYCSLRPPVSLHELVAYSRLHYGGLRFEP